jgi:hypothetical protein
MLKTLTTINTAGAVHLRGIMRTMCRIGMAPPQRELGNLASGFQWFAGLP